MVCLGIANCIGLKPRSKLAVGRTLGIGLSLLAHHRDAVYGRVERPNQ